MDDLVTIKKILNDSIRNVILNDQLLIRVGQERALSNKLGMYLFHQFSGWHVDCEYNRIEFGDELKQTSTGKNKRPDVIIHRRGHLGIENNLLWIEVKIKNDNVSDDTGKLKEFTSAPNAERKIQYRYGLSLSFVPEIQQIWFENGFKI